MLTLISIIHYINISFSVGPEMSRTHIGISQDSACYRSIDRKDNVHRRCGRDVALALPSNSHNKPAAADSANIRRVSA